MKIIAISDTHGRHNNLEVPDGDVLVFAGDITSYGELELVSGFNNWIGKLPHQYKLVIAGNHDFCFENEFRSKAVNMLQDCIYLEDNDVIIDNIKFYGSPWTPKFFNWAFDLERGQAIREKWELIPEDTDVLITHGPPFGHGDMTVWNKSAGCKDLLEIINYIKPRVHIFGHIHEEFGITNNENTTFVNASTCNLKYEPVNRPVEIDI